MPSNSIGNVKQIGGQFNEKSFFARQSSQFLFLGGGRPSIFVQLFLFLSLFLYHQICRWAIIFVEKTCFFHCFATARLEGPATDFEGDGSL